MTLNPVELRKKGIEALKKALGPVDMVRFLHQFDLGSGDYTKERKNWLTETKIEDIMEEMKKK